MPIVSYRNSLEHILDLLSRLDILLNLQLIRFQKFQSSLSKHDNALQGIAITDEEVVEIIRNPISTQQELSKTILDDSETKRLRMELARKENEIQQKVAESTREHVFLPFAHLADVFKLGWLEIDAIVACLALQIEDDITRRYEKVYAYLNDNLMQKKPTIDILLSIEHDYSFEERIRARSIMTSKNSPLFKYKIVEFVENDNNYDSYEYPIKIDEHIANFLLGSNSMDGRISQFAKLINRLSVPRQGIVLHDDNDEDHPLENIKLLLKNAIRNNHYYRNLYENDTNNKGDNNSKTRKIVLNFFGPKGSGRKTTADLLCSSIGIPLLTIDLADVISRGLPVDESLMLSFREALLSNRAAVYLQNFEVLLDKNEKGYYSSIKAVIRLVKELSWLTFLETSSLSWNANGSFNDCFFMNIEFKIPEFKARKMMWQSIAQSDEESIITVDMDNNGRDTGLKLEENVDFDALAGKFLFPPGKIRDSLAFARNLAIARKKDTSSEEPKITMEDLYHGCKSQSNQGLISMAKKIHPNYTWDDIVLPANVMSLLKDICNVVKYKGTVYYDWGFSAKFSLGKGLTALFTGDSGTGKTMAAEVIAKDLNLELYKIDLSSILNKYIGETEKNLNTIFKESEGSNSILFFDEADALFGKRTDVKDSHDRYANIETNYLLQKIDEFEGVAILSSNYKRNIDDAFIRRMQFIVNFPFPDVEYRHEIWKKAFPEQVPRSNDIDFRFLARNLQISGGNIKNIVVNSAFLAAKNAKRPISMSDIVLATKREFDKMGKPIQKSDFGKYSTMLDTNTSSSGSTTTSGNASTSTTTSSSSGGSGF
jgi:SpoVK/Ycf46/Vps4 family AAA+-type ATPase